jgi:HipA-like protein
MRKLFKMALSWLRDEGHEGLETRPGEEGTFVLRYRSLVIGTLRVHAGMWQFAYSDEFKRQNEVRPLVDFPDVDKKYESPVLWPFFLARIPSVAQPKVRHTIDEEGIDERSAVQLLERFGERSIANPFTLEPQKLDHAGVA